MSYVVDANNPIVQMAKKERDRFNRRSINQSILAHSYESAKDLDEPSYNQEIQTADRGQRVSL